MMIREKDSIGISINPMTFLPNQHAIGEYNKTPAKIHSWLIINMTIRILSTSKCFSMPNLQYSMTAIDSIQWGKMISTCTVANRTTLVQLPAGYQGLTIILLICPQSTQLCSTQLCKHFRTMQQTHVAPTSTSQTTATGYG